MKMKVSVKALCILIAQCSELTQIDKSLHTLLDF